MKFEQIVMPFLQFTAYWMNKQIGCDYHESIQVGLGAAHKAYSDKMILDDGTIKSGAKTYIRREILRATAPCRSPQYQNLIDYGYVDGRTTKRGVRVKAHNKYSRYRHKCRAMGLCPRCGKKPAENIVLCRRCQRIKNSYYKSRINTNLQKAPFKWGDNNRWGDGKQNHYNYDNRDRHENYNEHLLDVL